MTWEEYTMGEKLFPRKIAGEIYVFYVCCGVPYCLTPENSFGYPDKVMLSHGNGKAYTFHRYLTPWKLRKIEKILKSISYNIGGILA